MRSLVRSACATALLATAMTARAQPVDEAARATARRIAEQALAEYDRGSYKQALDDFDRADALVHAPTMSLMAARCLAKLGRLVEASERYLATSRMQVEPSASQAFKDAIADAAKERQELMPRIPTLEIALQGAKPNEVEVRFDGKPVPAAMIGIASVVDPGTHVIDAMRGSDHKTQTVNLGERDAQRIVVEFPPAATPAATTAPAHALEVTSAGAAASNGNQPTEDLRLPVGIGVMALGAVGVGVGVVAGAMAISKRQDLDQVPGCPDACDAASQRDVDAYNRLRVVSSIGFIGGAILSAGGAILALSAPRARAVRNARITPWIAGTRAGLGGTFR